jgi:hypothetical protein
MILKSVFWFLVMTVLVIGIDTVIGVILFEPEMPEISKPKEIDLVSLCEEGRFSETERTDFDLEPPHGPPPGMGRKPLVCEFDGENCLQWEDPIGFDFTFSTPGFVSIQFEFPYSIDPTKCFPPFSTEEGLLSAGHTELTILEVGNWIVDAAPIVQNWDGNTMIIGTSFDLYNDVEDHSHDFIEAWSTLDRDPDALIVDLFLKDATGHSIYVWGTPTYWAYSDPH